VGLKYVKPAPGRTVLTFAGFTFDEQEQIEGYAQQLVKEAHALRLRLQERYPMLREADRDKMYELEMFYRAQYHAMERLGRRKDDWQWIHARIMKARRWLERAQVESAN
jgi:hypothetical protein